MRLFSPSKLSPIILTGEHELEKLEEENERLRKLAARLKEEVDALRNGEGFVTSSVAAMWARKGPH